MKVEQQNNAIECMKNWLKHPNELGKEPADIELTDIFSYKDEEFAIIKFKKDESSPWLLGVCGGYIANEETHSGFVWSDFAEYKEKDAEKLCIEYIERIRKAHIDYANNIFVQLNALQNERKWQEIIDMVDKNIEQYRQPREKDGEKCYQFPHMFDFLYYVMNNREEECEWLKNDEYQLLNRKLYALIELKKYREAEHVIDEMLRLSPNNAQIRFQYLEIAKLEKDLDKCAKLLDEIYPDIWYYKDFCKYLRAYAWIAVERGEVEKAVNYLALSLQYDNSENAYNYVNNELAYIKRVFNIQNAIPQPTIKEVNTYFKGNTKVYPLEKNISFGYQLYEFMLEHREGEKPNIIQEAKHNLIMINRNYPFGAKAVEVNVLTPNKLIANLDFGFAFQVDKSYAIAPRTEQTKEKVIYELKNGKNTITIEKSVKSSTKEKFDYYIDYFKENLNKNGNKVVSETWFEGKNNIKARKLLTSPKTGRYYVYFYFQISPDTIGRVYSAVPEDHSSIEGEIVNIISTWEYLWQAEQNQEEKDILKIVCETLKIDRDFAINHCKEIKELNAFYFWSDGRGGAQMIIGSDGSKLVAGSAISFEELLSEFKNGKRN